MDASDAAEPKTEQPALPGAPAWPTPADYAEKPYQDQWKAVSRAYRAALERAVADRDADDEARERLARLVAELDRRCGGRLDLLALLLDQGDPKGATAQELWFEAGRAAAAEKQRDLAGRIGRFLVATSPVPALESGAPERPPQRARGLHLLALVSPEPEASDYARQAADAYRIAGFACPGEIARLAPARLTSSKKSPAQAKRLAGLPDKLTWARVTIQPGEPDPYSAVVTIRGAERTVTFADLGMRDGRGTKPAKRWDLLKAFARSDGRLPRPMGPGTDAMEKLVAELRRALQAAFGIVDDPIPLRREGNDRVWVCAFRIVRAARETELNADSET